MLFLRKLIIGLAAFASLVLTEPSRGAQTPAAPLTPAVQAAVGAPIATGSAALDANDLEAWLDGFLPYALDRGRVAGAVIVVVRGDRVVLQKGYGFADVKSRKPVSAETTLFRPGSVSKLFTWTAVMQLVEAGKLDLDKDINAYLDFRVPPYEGKPVTLRNMMTHRAGFEESYRYLISNDPNSLMPLQKLMPLSLPQRVFAPGTTPAYSNYATGLAGYIVQRVSGQPFDEYVEHQIFAPLKITRATFRQPLSTALSPLMANGYGTPSQKMPFEYISPAPAGSLAISGADMAKFMMAHLNDGGVLLRPETAQMMHNYRSPGIGPLNRMALGFYEIRVNGSRGIGHGGNTRHFHSYLWLFPEADIGLYISMNSTGTASATDAIRSALFHKFADRYLPGEEPGGRVDAATARQHAQMVAGHYVSSRGSFTNFMRLLGLIGQTEIVATKDGSIALPGLETASAAGRNWIEVAPFVWRDTATGEQLAAEVKDGKVVRVGLDMSSPHSVLMPAAASINAAWLIPALLAALTAVLAAAVAWPIRAIVRRRFGAPHPLAGRALRIWRLSRVFAWLVLLSVAGWFGLIIAFSDDPGVLGGPLDWLILSLRVLTPVATGGLLALAGWHLWLSWREKGRWSMKLGAILLLLAAAMLVWMMLAANLYGFGMVY